ncbi:MAG: hypothetical protein U0237_20745 [Thermoleophilia bacterium]
MRQRVVVAAVAAVLVAGAAAGTVVLTSGGDDAPAPAPARAVAEPGSSRAKVTALVLPVSTRSDEAVTGAEEAMRVTGAKGPAARAAAAKRLRAGAAALDADAGRLANAAGSSSDQVQVEAVVAAMRAQAAANRRLAAAITTGNPTAKGAGPHIEAAWATARATRAAADQVGIPSS